jgi:hypothetical protein
MIPCVACQYAKKLKKNDLFEPRLYEKLPLLANVLLHTDKQADVDL